MSDYTPEQTLTSLACKSFACQQRHWKLNDPVEIHGQTVEGRPITGSYSELRLENGETVGWIAAEFPSAAAYIEAAPPPIGRHMAATLLVLGEYMETLSKRAEGPEDMEMLRESYERLRDALLYRSG